MESFTYCRIYCEGDKFSITYISYFRKVKKEFEIKDINIICLGGSRGNTFKIIYKKNVLCSIFDSLFRDFFNLLINTMMKKEKKATM